MSLREVSVNNVIIIDCRVDEQYRRRLTLATLCQELGYAATLWEQVPGSRVLTGKADGNQLREMVAGAQLVLLHAGSDQIGAAKALQELETTGTRCLAYYGGTAAAPGARAYFTAKPRDRHALIEEKLPPELTLSSASARKVKDCLRLILQEGRCPQEAVEVVYGEPELEDVLNDLYWKLSPWVDFGEIRKCRDEQLGKYYDAKRGWTAPADEAGGRRGRGESIVAHLDTGAFPDEGDAARLLYAAEVKIMRELVAKRPTLVERVLQIAESETGARPAFALALIRHACSEPATAARLRRLFDERATTDPRLACHLVWRVLDDPDLPEDWHKRLIDYLMSNWDAWKRHLAEFREPGPDGMIAVIRGRLDDPTYPSSKKWIYLLCLPDGLASDGQEAERMIRKAAGSGEENIRFVAEVLLRRFCN